MTTFGADVSNHNAGFKIAEAKKQGYDFFTAKCTEGTSYVDPYYNGFRADAQAAGVLFGAYHLLHRGNARKQADFFCQHIGDKSIPGQLDFEPMGDNPRVIDAVTFIRRCKKHGVQMKTDYLPKWYWQQLGSPSLRKRLPAEWQSSYGSNRHDHGAAVYPGDQSPAWDAFGGVTPTILQFTSTGLVDGYDGNVDLDAFRGSRDELAALGLFKDYGQPKERPHGGAHRKPRRRWFWFHGFWPRWHKAHPHRQVPEFVKGDKK